MDDQKYNSTKEGILTHTLISFFSDPSHLNVMIPILTESSPISLRILDWFITNYSKDHVKTLVKDPFFKDFNVYSSYKGQLKAFNKKLFDPFCRLHMNSRVKKFDFTYGTGKTITTTIGQLNFFKWAIENKVIDYVIAHYDEIKADLRRKEKDKHSSSRNSSTRVSPCTSESPECVRKVYVIKFD